MKIGQLLKKLVKCDGNCISDNFLFRNQFCHFDQFSNDNRLGLRTWYNYYDSKTCSIMFLYVTVHWYNNEATNLIHQTSIKYKWLIWQYKIECVHEIWYSIRKKWLGLIIAPQFSLTVSNKLKVNYYGWVVLTFQP